MERFVGVDLHSNSFTVCYLTPETDEKKFETFKLKCLADFAMNLNKEDMVVVETTTNTRYFKKKVEEYVKIERF